MCSPSSIRLRLPYDGRRRGDAAKNRPRKSVRIADPEFTILKDDEVADTSVEIIPTDSDVDSVGAETFQTERETENIRSEHKHSPRTCDDVGFLIVESSSCRPSTDASSTPNDKVDPQKTSGRTPHRLSHLNDDRNFNCHEARTVNKGGTRHSKRVHNKRSSPKSVAETSRQRKPAARTFHCKLCGETFTTERLLTSHHAKNHGGSGDVEKRLVCGKCGKQFREQFLLLAHMAVHNGIQKCETCSKLFTTVDALQMHQRVHRRKVTPVKCGGNPAASADSRVAAVLPKETASTATVNETEKVDLKRCHAVDDCDSNTVWGEKYGAGPIRTRLVEKRPAKSNAVKRLKIILERPGKTELAQSVKSVSERLTATPDSPDVEDGGGFESDEEGVLLRIDVRSDFRCTECDKYFVSAEFLRAHNELHRVAPPGFGVRCTRCRERFDYLFEMHAHVAQHHGSRRADTAAPAVLICIKCGVRAETVNRLLLHALTHTGEMPNRCISCAQCFLSRLELEQHACTSTGVPTGRPNSRLSRSSEQLVVSGSVVSCLSVNEPRPAIGTAPSDNTGTIRQPTDVANGSEVTTFECRECEKQFLYRYELLAHKTSHTSTTQCSLCHKVFTTFQQLKNHLRWHTGEMVLRCQVCDASFCSLVALRKHCTMVHQQKTVANPITVSDRTASRTPTPAPAVDTDPEFQVQCPVCDRWFAGRSFLTTHVRLHVSGSVKPGVWFTCVHCSKRFNFQYELQTHVSLLHADMKCILCHRRFSDESSLRVDALQHTGELPYTCDSCNKSFRSETQLRSHINSSHLVVHTEAPMEHTPPNLSDTNRCVSDDEQQIEID